MVASILTVKICKKCGCSFEGRNGLVCKYCISEYNAKRYAENPQVFKDRSRKWIKENPDKAAANRIAWKKANPERRKVEYKKYREMHKKEINARSRERHARKKVEEKEYLKKWEKNNPNARRIIRQNREARKAKNGGRLSNGIAEKLIKLQRGKCACCSKMFNDGFQLDHILPIARGGRNEDSNIQLLCPFCNRKKHAKDPIEFMQSLGYLI
jgi:5-methylcytosine-specific restriction endonuclease McrA